MVKIAIVCEGTDDFEFLKKLINHLELNEKKVSPYIFKGKSFVLDETHKKYVDLKLEVDNQQIEKILFIVDSDNEKSDMKNGGYENTQIALDILITKLGFETISKTYIMCDPRTKNGYLESLILSTIQEQQRHCIECFLTCSNFKSKEHHKAIFNDIYTLAYPNAPFDFEHENFNELKSILKNLFTF